MVSVVGRDIPERTTSFTTKEAVLNCEYQVPSLDYSFRQKQGCLVLRFKILDSDHCVTFLSLVPLSIAPHGFRSALLQSTVFGNFELKV